MVLPDTIQRHLPKFPEGDPGAIRAGATAWRTLAGQIDTVSDSINIRASGTPSWSGPARDAFDAHWSETRTGMSDLANHMREAAGKLDELADALGEAQRQYEGAIAAVGVTVVVGVGFSILTAGVGAAPTAEVVASETAAAVGLIARTAVAVKNVLTVIASMIRTLGPRFAVNFGVGFGTDVANQEIVNLFKGESLTHVSLTDALVSGAEAGILGSLVDPKLGGMVDSLTRNLSKPMTYGGKSVVSGLESGAVDAMNEFAMEGELDATSLGVSVVTGGAVGTATARLGKHGGEAGPHQKDTTALAGSKDPVPMADLRPLSAQDRPLTQSEQALARSETLRSRTLALDETSRAALPPDLWDLKATTRGTEAEGIIRDNLARARPDSEFLEPAPHRSKIDAFDLADGTTTSITTIDPRADSYATESPFASTLGGRVTDLQNFAGTDWSGAAIAPEDIGTRELVVGLPPDGLTSMHVKALEDLVSRFESGDDLVLRFVVL